MNDLVPPPGPAMTSGATVRLVEIDELSDVRYIHSSSLKVLASGQLSEPEILAFVAHVYSDPYTAMLADMVRARRLFGVTIDGQLSATAGWMPANDSGATARMFAVFAAPMFAGAGLGRLAAHAAEGDAAQAGFEVASVRTPIGAVGFFQRLGYDVSSWGAWSLGRDCALPVAFMRRSLGKTDAPASERAGGLERPRT